jgi:hypothetical protein
MKTLLQQKESARKAFELEKKEKDLTTFEYFYLGWLVIYPQD